MAHKKKHKDEAAAFAVASARLSQDSNCEDIVVLDLRDVSPITDFFVICTGTSNRQIRSAADDICEYGKANDYKVWHVAGMDSGGWIVLDFLNVVVHIFDQTNRDYYDIEMIWGGSPKIDWQQETGK